MRLTASVMHASFEPVRACARAYTPMYPESPCAYLGRVMSILGHQYIESQCTHNTADKHDLKGRRPPRVGAPDGRCYHRRRLCVVNMSGGFFGPQARRELTATHVGMRTPPKATEGRRKINEYTATGFVQPAPQRH